MGDKKTWRKRRGDGLVAWRASKRAKLGSDCENKENVSSTTHILVYFASENSPDKGIRDVEQYGSRE
jgi:hypothetical protein